MQACTVRTVAFEFKPRHGIRLMPAEEKAKYTSEMWHLPRLRSGTATADHDGKGPPYFTTSQLTGCRFMVAYVSADRKAAKVLHLAGDVGTGPKGTQLRDEMAKKAGVDPTDNSGRVRSYSLGSGKKPRLEKVGTDLNLKRDGNEARVSGVRDDSGAWTFYAQEMYARFGAADEPLRLPDLTA